MEEEDYYNNDFLMIGDYICLYCEETEGYVFGCQTSSAHNALYIYHRQDASKPANIPNPHCVTFQICIQNRYKLQKKYRKLLSQSLANPTNLHIRSLLHQAKEGAKAEMEDNACEERRQRGARVRYGTIIQLKHTFTEKFVHASTTETSKRDKNNMRVSIEGYSAHQAHFRLLPRYKVKSEGEIVQIGDQIVLESVKCNGQYLHSSAIFTIDHVVGRGSELNLAVDQTGFTVVRYSRAPKIEETPTSLSTEYEDLIKGGSVVRLFHKELEAYVVAEGLFNESLIEQVHLRIRPVDQMIAKTLYPSTSAITYWQIESESSVLNGHSIRWQTQIRLRHFVTRLYLKIDQDNRVGLSVDGKHPNTVFRFHPLMREADEMRFESYARLEHVLSGSWLHADRDSVYEKRAFGGHGDDGSMNDLRWDGAELRTISATNERMYHDAYTLQKVDEINLAEANFVAGQVPFLTKLIRDLEARIPKPDETSFLNDPPSNSKKDGGILNVKRNWRICTALRELQDFLIIDNQPIKRRQKLMRNFCIIDLLVKILQLPVKDVINQELMTEVTKSVYGVLHTYMMGNSRKNSLYFAKYIDFFQSKFSQAGEIGLDIAQMIVELIKDNREIVDRISRRQIDEFIHYVRKYKNYRYLDLLNVLCVCNGVAISNNQSYITEKWLVNDNRGVYLTQRGQNIRRQTNIIYISTDLGYTWSPLHEFVKEGSTFYDEEQKLFLEHQLDLFRKLCDGRNEYVIQIISRELKYISWEEAFLCVRLNILPDELRAKYCDLIIGLFVDVGNNYAVLEYRNLSFAYDDIDIREPIEDGFGEGTEIVVKDLVTIFPVLRDWIMEVLNNHEHFVASNVGYNKLIEQVVKLLDLLVKYGYYGAERDIKDLQTPLLTLLEGENDIPFPVEEAHSSEAKKLLKEYKEKMRYEKTIENSSIVEVKYQALQVLELLLNYQFQTRLKYFVALFKQAERGRAAKKTNVQLQTLLSPSFDPGDQSKYSIQRKLTKTLREAFDKTSYFEKRQLIDVLLDLSKYNYDKLVVKSLSVLNKFFSSRTGAFQAAIDSQILLTADSVRVHRDFIDFLPMLRRLARAKISPQQVETTVAILDKLRKLCQVPYDINERHSINQNILLNHDILSIIFDTLNSQRIDSKLIDDYREARIVIQKTLELLKSLTKNNEIVQRRVFERLDLLLTVTGVENQIALTLREAFVNNRPNCLKISPKQLERIVNIISNLQCEAPEFLSLLSDIVRGDSDIPLKRNQTYIIKYIIRNYSRIAYILDKPREQRETLLTNRIKSPNLDYLIRLVELLAVCADGENKFIEALCQSAVPLEELLEILKNDQVSLFAKQYYILFAHNVYLRTSSSIIDTGTANLSHDPSLWSFMVSLIVQSTITSDYISKLDDETAENFKPLKIETNMENEHFQALHFLLDYAMPFLRTFFSKFYSKDADIYPEEPEIVRQLAASLWAFVNSIKRFVTDPKHLKTIVSCMTTILPASESSGKSLDAFIESLTSIDCLKAGNYSNIGHEKYYEAEIELNRTFKTFAINASLVYGGPNTVAAQLKLPIKKYGNKPYVDLTSHEKLPLGEEFQEHINCFYRPNEKTFASQIAQCSIIIKQLGISGSDLRMTEASKVEQEELDIKCLQLLRGVIHNHIVKLPNDWEEHPLRAKRELAKIAEVQTCLCTMGAIVEVLPLLTYSSDDMARETLAFLSSILFNANRQVQRSLIDYFKATREEVFFLAVRNRMHLSTISIKERKSLAAQNRRITPNVKGQHDHHYHDLRSTIRIRRDALEKIEHYESTLKRNRKRKSRRASLATLQTQISTKSIPGEEENKDLVGIQVEEDRNSIAEGNHTDDEVKDGGFIELVLKVLAQMCDGQYVELQDYLRDQPDNIKSFNLIAETASFLSMVYSNVTSSNIDLVIQLFETLNEFASGNQANRAVIVTNKVVDYANFILRSCETDDFTDCSSDKILTMKKAISSLIYSLIEENGREKLKVACEVKDTVDKEAFYKVMTDCYWKSQDKYPKIRQLLHLNRWNSLNSAKESLHVFSYRIKLYASQLIKGRQRSMADEISEVGFSYFNVIARLNDIGALQHRLTVAKQKQMLNDSLDRMESNQKKAFEYFKRNTMTIEIVKDDDLQKIHFRVRSQQVLREQIKEKLKWSVDRSSPSNKIRDLMNWSKDIVTDIYYQRKILSNWLAAFITRRWLAWNYGVILLSLAINFLMLVSWNAKFSLIELPNNATSLPSALWDPIPQMKVSNYYDLLYVLGGCHAAFCVLLFISYLLSNHPRLPNLASARSFLGLSKETDLSEDGIEISKKRIYKSKLDVHLLSLSTLYYVALVGLSLAGTFYHGYFFAFHLLNIVNNNQLLIGVIQAVTQNGRSLIWVAILGLIMFYLYAVIGFAVFRDLFKPQQHLYCASLWQCTVTMIRYGLVGDYSEVLHRHHLNNSFVNFAYLAIYEVSFFVFITTIGLNIIFGIIVDTFSELRDLKWTAERDMRDTCFICSRKSYDFEHHGLGFNHHVQNEHNMWAYIFFFIHLHDTKQNDYTALDLYVFKLLGLDRHTFFPLNRALSLSTVDDDSTESKIDELLENVSNLVEKQKWEENEKKRLKDRDELRQWQERHRHMAITRRQDREEQQSKTLQILEETYL
ncbi:DgyrCDS5116 [Dimorphilus gyrociliatus]|uniref:Inositol 1,4,5-trisphosphate receptor n=1 Tax=Dimorphilus gyrociliatus TaxID=2664684 RepID=A0A7I8VJH6_9ANNE|nr:DgyrCDS5116 [Dimorphilus gyrociliatus]